VVYNKGGTVFGKDVFIEPVKKYISVYFHQRLTIIPRCWPNKTMICPFLSSVEKVASKLILQAAQRFHTLQDIV
jgi:hypothetical protein